MSSSLAVILLILSLNMNKKSNIEDITNSAARKKKKNFLSTFSSPYQHEVLAWRLSQRLKVKKVLHDISGKRHQPRREQQSLWTWYCDSLFYSATLLLGKQSAVCAYLQPTFPPQWEAAAPCQSPVHHPGLRLGSWSYCQRRRSIRESWRWGSGRLAAGGAISAMTRESGTDAVTAQDPPLDCFDTFDIVRKPHIWSRSGVKM